MFLTQEQLEKCGFKKLGHNIKISNKASIYNPESISIGDYCRIDDFCILSAGQGGISLDSYVHIGCYSSLIGAANITMKDFSGLSSRVSIYSSSDNYDGTWMTNPCIPKECTSTYHEEVLIGKHSVIGSGSILLPGVKLNNGASVGAMSLVKKGIYDGNIIIAGIPAQYIKNRRSNIFFLEQKIK